MADEIMPAQIRNGGTGSVQVGSAGGPDYRQVQAPVNVNTDLPDNGAAARAEALSGLFKEFEGVSANVRQQAATQSGALAGAASGDTGHPQYKQGLARFTAYGRAFNNAATGAYAIQAEAQADDDAARLRSQANKNPETFFATFSANRDAVLKSAPADAVPMLTELYNRKLAQGVAAIRGDQLGEQRALQRQQWDEGVSRQVSRVATLQGSQNPDDQLRAQDEQVKLNLLIDGGMNSGLYSKAEAEAMHISSMRTITGQVFSTQVDQELMNPNGDPFAMLERFREAHIKNLQSGGVVALSEPEFQKLMSDATTKIREWNMAKAYDRREGKTEEQLRYEAGDKLYTDMLLNGTLTEKSLSDGVRADNLKPETARALRSALIANATGAPAKSDPAALARLLKDPNFLDLSGRDISLYPGLSEQDKLSAVREQARRNASWEGTQDVKDAKKWIDYTLKVPSGPERSMAAPEDLKAADAAHDRFVQLMKQEDPAKRDGSARQHAAEAVQYVQKQLASDRITAINKARQSFIKNFGPGSSGNMDKDKYETRLKQYADQIAEQKAIVDQK